MAAKSTQSSWFWNHFKKEIKIWLLHGSVTFKHAHSLGICEGFPGAVRSWARRVLPLMAYTREAPTEKSALFTQFQVYERVEISWVEVYKRVGKFVISVKKGLTGAF